MKDKCSETLVTSRSGTRAGATHREVRTMTGQITTRRPAVTVVGLGAMGASIARALLQAGVPVTVWNRSPGRATALVESGATSAADLGAAVATADLVLVCVRDHDAAREVLATAAPSLRPRADVVNLSTATARQARLLAEWAASRQLSYLSGAIMVPTPLIGSPDALIFYSGPRAVLDRHLDTLRLVAGNAAHLGSDHGRAAVFDIAMLDVFFAGMTSFLHAAALVAAEGVSAETFLPHAQGILDVLRGSLAGLARGVDTGRHPGVEDTLAMERDFLAHIVESSEQAGVDPALPALMLDYARRAVDAGHGDESYSRLVDLLVRPQEAAA
jgi:3-hydroxyisobutyrate dehydrogenase-like beta-hydroxyacid dehydrogenase